MKKLFPIKHDLPGILWCGPAALSATTGHPTSAIHAAIRKVRGNHSTAPVKGVTNSALICAAKVLGYRLESVFDYWDDLRVHGQSHEDVLRPTLAGFTRKFRAHLKSHTLIVNVTGHYVVVSGRTFVDNQVGRPTPLMKAPGRRRRVKAAWQVIPLTVVPTSTTLPV